MITIIDYGMGNLGSIQNMLKKIGAPSRISSNLSEIEESEKLILPGVGSFGQAMENLHKMGVIPIISKKVEEKTPLLGICLGMQLLASRSEEGNVEGLNIIPGNVIKFQLPDEFKIPHMGWNLLDYKKECPLYKGFEDLEEVRYYFVHTYHYVLENENFAIGKTKYGFDFTSAVQKDNVYGVQFHPEKSHTFGMRLLTNFHQL